MPNNPLFDFEIFSDLDVQSRLIAGKLMPLQNYPKGSVLFEVGENDDAEFFLHEGEIELVATDGVKKIITAGQPAAHFPLALLRPRKFSAVVTSKIAKLYEVEVRVLRQLKKTVPIVGDAFSAFSPVSDDIKLSEGDEIDAVQRFLSVSTQAVLENRMMLSNFDDVSTTIFNVINNDEASLDVIISAVQLDPAISAKLIKSANSAFFGGMHKVDSVRAAVVRLGLNLTVELVTVMVVKEVFTSNKENLQSAMHSLWQASLKLATYSVVIGKRSSCQFQQGQTLLAGLMNEIGTLVIIAFLDQFPGMMINISEHILSSEKVKKKLGTTLLTHWQFSESLINVLEFSDKYDREIDAADLCDVVTIAKLLIRRTSYRKLPISEITELPAYKRLGFDSEDPHIIESILHEAGDYVKLFTGAFD